MGIFEWWKRAVKDFVFAMNILINCTNMKAGGGIQVSQSICGELKRFAKHKFIVVLSSYINDKSIDFGSNIELYHHNIQHDFSTVLTGRDSFLDELATAKEVDVVLTVFGPSIWRPRVPHLCGFARAQLLLKVKGHSISLKERIAYKAWEWGFKKSSKVFYTENAFISRLLENKLKDVKVYTVSNYYNQVFDQPEKWTSMIKLPEFDGVTCLSISSNYPHKNFGIIPEVIRAMKMYYPEFNLRFVLTIDEKEMPVDDDVKDNILFIGKVDVAECPNLYEQADVMFMPTLLECFTATYPEAMRMDVPIVTTDLEFARGLCGEAACYYSAVDAGAAAEAIYKVAKDAVYRNRLVENGKKQLLTYDNYEQRAEKLIDIMEKMVRINDND